MCDHQASEESVQLQPGKGKDYVGTSFLPILMSSDKNSYQWRKIWIRLIPTFRHLGFPNWNTYGGVSSRSKQPTVSEGNEVKIYREENPQGQEYYSTMQV